MRREIFQGVQWIIKETCGLKKGDYTRVLLNELLNISHKMGVAIRMKKKLHKFAEKNRMYITKYYLK